MLSPTILAMDPTDPTCRSQDHFPGRALRQRSLGRAPGGRVPQPGAASGVQGGTAICGTSDWGTNGTGSRVFVMFFPIETGESQHFVLVRFESLEVKEPEWWAEQLSHGNIFQLGNHQVDRECDRKSSINQGLSIGLIATLPDGTYTIRIVSSMYEVCLFELVRASILGTLSPSLF